MDCVSEKSIVIVQGSDVGITLQFVDKRTRQPINLAGLQSADFRSLAASGGVIAASGSLVSADLATVLYQLDQNYTGAMQSGDSLDYEAHATVSGKVIIAQRLGQLTVSPQIGLPAP